MPLTVSQLAELPSPFYRVAVKALVLDDERRLLILLNEDGEAELPGGGWEHGESLEECLAREVAEETHGEVTSVSGVVTTFTGKSRRGWSVLRVVVRATLRSLDNLQPDDGIVETRMVTKDEFAHLTWAQPDEGIAKFADTIWSEGN